MEQVSYNEMLQKIQWFNRFHMQDKVDILNALQQEFGEGAREDMLRALERIEGEKARLEWQAIAKQTQDHSIEALIRFLWEPLRQKGFEFTYEACEKGIKMHCTRCPIFDMAKAVGGTDWMYHHTCSTDPEIAAGFNPDIGMERTKTLMQGDDCCDHLYFYKNQSRG